MELDVYSQTERGKKVWRWRAVENGRTYLFSEEPFSSREICRESAKKAKLAKLSVKQSKHGYWILLRAKNGETMGRSALKKNLALLEPIMDSFYKKFKRMHLT